MNILLGVIGTKLTASFIGYVAALGKGIYSTVEATRATNAQAQAALMAAKADQIAAASAVVRAQKEADAARGTAVQTALSLELAQARMAETAATARLGVAQAAVKASSGVLMTVLGGPAGLAALAVGAGIAFLTMGSNAQPAGADLDDLKRPIEELRKAFRELDKDQRGAALVGAMRVQEQAAADADKSYQDFLITVKRGWVQQSPLVFPARRTKHGRRERAYPSGWMISVSASTSPKKRCAACAKPPAVIRP